jgi:hypothetical protein
MVYFSIFRILCSRRVVSKDAPPGKGGASLPHKIRKVLQLFGKFLLKVINSTINKEVQRTAVQ